MATLSSLTLELGTPDASRVQEAVQRVLVEHDLSSHDDTVMAEYVTVMIANRKGPAMIADELRELVGGDLDPSVTRALWKSACDILAPAAELPSSLHNEQHQQQPELRRQRQRHSESYQPQSKHRSRSRSASPPRSRAQQQASPAAASNERWDGEHRRSDRSTSKASKRDVELFPSSKERRNNKMRSDDKPASVSILGRAGVPDPRAPPFMPPFPEGMAAPFPDGVPPPFAAMAAMAAMASGGPSLFARLDPMMPNNPPPMPGAGLTISSTPQTPPFGLPGLGADSFPNGPPVLRDIAAFPTKPSEGALCRWSVQCTNPMCPYSHPSPANAGRDGDPSALVLKADICEHATDCADKECVRSHVSPAVSFIKARGSVPPPSGVTPCKFQQSCLNPACTFTHFDQQGQVVPPPGQMHAAPGPGSTAATSIPCRYGTGCTRPDCVYMHPMRSTVPSQRSHVPCRYGDGCTRPDCYYTHPRDGPRHPTSERLKAFATDEEGEDRERIIPGEQSGDSTTPMLSS